MAEEPIKDGRGITIAFVNTIGNGDQFVLHKDGYPLGNYDVSMNVTRDPTGRIVAQGNQIGMLLRPVFFKTVGTDFSV
ncbi:hypothetical protein [Marinobacter sp. SS5-14b]|uniref:hypothetical protein n=1 Tax=Marinobacter sp. SS5-14b TaxID=3050456 RepID=UPI0026DFF7D2|nr:hypothetical protein [Marinobacter sp. SS5-14b]